MLAGKTRIADQFRQARLVFGQLAFVILLAQFLRQVEFAEHVPAVDRLDDGRRHRHLRQRLLQAALHGIENDAADGQRAVGVIGALDDDPRRLGRIGHAQHMTGHFLQLVVGLQPVVTFLGHPPGRARVLFQRLQALLLGVLGQVEPELEYQRAFVDQHRLETVDVVKALIEFSLTHVAGDTVGNRLRVPGTGKDADLALGRQGAPVAPHDRAGGFLVARLGKGQRRDVSRVHPRIQEVDRFPLAAAVDPGNQDDDRKLLFLQDIVLNVEQSGAQLRHLLPEDFLVDLVSQFCRFEHLHSPLKSPHNTCRAANAASPAVSVRNTRGPRRTARKPDCRAAITSCGSSPPSAPISSCT